MEEEVAEDKRKKGLRDGQGEHVRRWRERKAGEMKSQIEGGEVKGGRYP